MPKTRATPLGALAVTLLATLATCAPRVTEHRPRLRVPASFSGSGQAELPVRWWRAFGDAELDRLVKLALARNPELHGAWARLEQSRALARKAGAGLLPTLNAEAELGGTVSRESKSASLVLGLAASYEVDLWGRVRASRDAARLDVRATRQTLRAVAISLSAEVANAWFQLVERQGQLALLEQQTKLTERVLALVDFKFRQGQARAADVLQQRQLAESLKGDRTQLESQAQVLRHQLAILTGRPPGKLVPKGTRRLPGLPPLPKTGVPARLLERRPDVRAAFYRVRAADRRVAAAVADRLPRLSIGARANVTGGFNPTTFYSWLANLAANLVAPLFDGGARKAEVARTRAVASEALSDYARTVLVALREVEDALARERQHVRYVASLARQLELSSVVVAQTRHSYLNGEEEYLRVLDALIKHQTLERARSTARRDLLLNRVALCRALAGGWKLAPPGATPAPERPARARVK